MRPFFARVHMTDGCWVWLGALSKGYGIVQRGGKRHYAHRYAYERAVGPIPEGLELHHVCENPRCVRPDHLVPVTRKNHPGNTADIRRSITHCPKGHPYSGDNLYVWRDKRGRPHRKCRTCQRARNRRQRRKGEVSVGVDALALSPSPPSLSAGNPPCLPGPFPP